jgi:hypothetical protein
MQEVTITDDFRNNLTKNVEVPNACTMGAFVRACRNAGIMIWHEAELEEGL